MEEEVKVEVIEEPTGGGVKEEITVPIQTDPNGFDSYSLPTPVPSFGPPVLPVPKLPMGTITETITIPATLAPPQKPYRKEVNTPTKEKQTLQIKKEPSGEIKITREICDGEVHLGPFKSCLKEFTGVTAIGWISAAAGLIVLWKWLDYKFKK